MGNIPPNGSRLTEDEAITPAAHFIMLPYRQVVSSVYWYKQRHVSSFFLCNTYIIEERLSKDKLYLYHRREIFTG